MASSASLLLLLVAASHVCCCHGQGGDNGAVAAIYSLGDSITDTGNLAKEAPPGAFETIKHLPYGVTFGRPTGRCSDGLLMIDFLAQDMGLPFLNPYLAKNMSFAHGVNFAVAGATAMDLADQFNGSFSMPFTSNSLKLQLRWFKDSMKSTYATHAGNSSISFPLITPQCTLCFQQSGILILYVKSVCAVIRKRLQSSLVLVGEIGGNDYNFAFYANKSVSEVEKMIPAVVQTIINATKEVLDMGASRVIVPGNFPIGCLPSYLTAMAAPEPSAYDSTACLKDLNLFAAKHNTQLQQAVAGLQASYPDAAIAYADYFNSFLSLLKGAPALGFDSNSTHKACCGAGGRYNYDLRLMCGVEGTAVCADPSAYVSWDGIHMTQAAYKAMSRLIYHGRYLQPQILNFPEKNGQT
ncbi:acetylajmalan esterase isoform X1 [Triticum aestivum]|uniref:acetylajmalan esterase isoform X1 n=1 Tax=Triticum aestivum TaxID=4565 RepID=UPI001D015697|nr:acetylajmalan esterase-like isoform X1 [Triticum aestivum]